ncbi:hypothetical protein L6452_16015 [Arctium lappa]|uniref:Uncharacterized protein n=1 Tax=Arctium lappa TaxID=4217 RepID=A0ACB9CQN0_ARCLA|nr:hypothetical protein L6452_16015 [Arctium lappa]
MASFSSKFFTFRLSCLIVGVLLISNNPLLLKGDPSLVNKVCAKTSDPKLCSDTLNSDPSTAEAATPYDLGLASLGLATAKASSTLDIIRGAINQNPAYKICEDKYNIAITNLNPMKDAFVHHDYMDVRKHSLILFSAITECGAAFGTSKPMVISNAERYILILNIVVIDVEL